MMRRWIDLMEAAAGLPLPSVDEVFPEEEVRRIFEYGFDVGRRYGQEKAEERDAHAIERFFWDHDMDDYDPDGEDEFRMFAEWLRGVRYGYIVRNIRSDAKMQDGLLVIQREIIVPEKTAHAIAAGDIPHLGEFWSYTHGEAHWGEHGSGVDVTLRALVDPQRVDWVTSIRRMANYLLGDEETEISLVRGTPLRLTAVILPGRRSIPVTAPDQQA